MRNGGRGTDGFGVKMSKAVKINRSRRNALKAASITLGAALASVVPRRKASADPGNGNRNGNGNGGNGNHYGWGSCFLRGTRILTGDGYRPIEDLAVGEVVATRFGGFAPIKAVDSFTLDREAGAWVGASRPVRVKRGALGENVPEADLCLTASHALFVDGFLVPAGNLVNGLSIVFETADGQDALDFFHIALERHEVIDAEGAPCESLRAPAAEPCVPLLGFNGGKSEVRSRVRSALSLIVDRRQPIDIIRDGLEERARELAQAA
jgi:hypothetical protein